MTPTVAARKPDNARKMTAAKIVPPSGRFRQSPTQRTAATILSEPSPDDVGPSNGGLVIDTFDNSASRRLVQQHCRALGLACLHVGLYADYGEVIWDERYRVPGDVAGDVCDYPLARNLVLLAVAVASETVVRFALTGARPDWSVTPRDFAVRAFET
jgi:hypothetical protein